MPKSIDPTSFFDKIFSGTKDAINYIKTSGNKPYLINRALVIDQENFRNTPYYHSYAQRFNRAAPSGFLHVLPNNIVDVGTGKDAKGLVFYDFMLYGSKTVVLHDPRYMKVIEQSTAFEIDAEKEKAAIALKKESLRAQVTLNNLSERIAKLKAKDRVTFIKAQQGLLVKLASVPGITTQVTKKEKNVNGLGAEPLSTTTIVVIVAVSVAILSYAAIKIIESVNYTKQITSSAENIGKEIDRKLNADNLLAKGTISDSQHKEIVDTANTNIDKLSDTQADIIKEKQSEEAGGLGKTIKTIALVALGIAVLKVGSDFYTNNHKTQNA